VEIFFPKDLELIFKDKKITLVNPITFALLIQKLWNEKSAQCLIKEFLMVSKKKIAL
jgi:hypothetical protein